LLNDTEQRFRLCVGYFEKAIDESQAFLVACDREPVDVVPGLGRSFENGSGRSARQGLLSSAIVEPVASKPLAQALAFV
jgi:hypothetical protein